MKATPADAFRAALERDGIVLEFGESVQPQSTDGAAVVSLTDRVLMPLETARRLRHTLEETLRRQRPAVPGAQAAAGQEPEPTTLRGRTPVNAPPDAAGAQAALLLRLVGELGVPYQYERSFRIAPGALLANRYLLTLDKRDIPDDAQARALGICSRLNMPDILLAQAAAQFDMAHCVHFGFEGGSTGAVCKLYLERAIGAGERAAAIASSEPVLMHLAYKWDTSSGAHVVTEYLWYPGIKPREIDDRLARVYGGGDRSSLAIAREALELVSAKIPAERMQYLEVLEEANGRRSFDLNLYQAGLQLKDLQSLLYRMRDHFAVRPGSFQALYDQVRNRSFGHLAGGVHRDGQEFFNVYYGVEGFPRFGDRLPADR